MYNSNKFIYKDILKINRVKISSEFHYKFNVYSWANKLLVTLMYYCVVKNLTKLTTIDKKKILK